MAARQRMLRPLVVLTCAALGGAVGGVALERFKAAREEDRPLSEAALDQVAPPVPPLRPGRTPLASAAALTGLPPYPGARPQDLAPDMRVQGMPIHIAWFGTPDSPEDVVHFYEDKLAEDGKLLVSHLYNERSGYVGYLELPAKKMHLISVLREGDQTLVFPSSSELAGDLAPGKLPDSVPRVGEAGTVMTFHDSGVLLDTLFATVPAKTVDEVLELYQRGFAEKGWEVSPPVQSARDGLRLQARQGHSTATVMMRRASPAAKPGVSVYLTLTTASPR